MKTPEKSVLSADLIVVALAECFTQAQAAVNSGEVPVGAVVVSEGNIISKDRNRILENRDATAHAELLVLKSAAKIIGSERLTECFLFSSLEPCLMCTGALVLCRVREVHFMAYEPRYTSLTGILDTGRFNHIPRLFQYPEWESRSAALLKSFFQSRRGTTEKP